MATYEGNAREVVSVIRRGLNEYSTAYLQSTDTSGLYLDAFLTDMMNNAQNKIYALLLKHIPDQFKESTAITGVDSVFALPWNFGKIIEFRDANGHKVHPVRVSALPATGATGSKSEYHRKGNTLVLTRSGVSDTYTLWYRTKPRRIHHGQTTDGDAESILFPSTYAPTIADYYNGMSIEDYTADWVDTIDGYTAARVATISETAADSDWYGIVSELPEVFHPFIAPRAIILAKEIHPAAQEKPSIREIGMWSEELTEAIRGFGGEGEDITPEDIWLDFPTIASGPGPGYNIPGH